MFQYTPYALIMLGAGVVAAFLAIVIWRRRPGAGVVPFSVLMLAVALWATSNGVRLLVVPLNLKIILHSLLFVGIVTVPAAWLIFVFEYTGREQWVTRRNLLLLSIMPILTIIALITDPVHGQFYLYARQLNIDGLVVLDTEGGTGFWIHATYSYILLLSGIVLLIQNMIRQPQLYRGQIVWLLVGAFAPWIANFIYIFDYSPLPIYVDLTPLSFTILGIAAAWSMYRYRLMDVVPVAKDLVMDSIADAVIVLDRSNRIIDANQAAMTILAMTQDEVIGRNAALVLSGQAELVEKFREIESAAEEIAVSVRGEPRFFNMQISPIYNRQNELTGRVIVLHDITALKKINVELVEARRKAEEANDLKSQFVATMSHELRTPLNAISGFTEILLTGMAGELTELQHSNLERIFSNATDLRRLIDDMLDLAKIEAGRMELVKKPFLVAKWLDDIVNQTRSLAEEKGLRYTAMLDKTLPEMIVGDQNRLKQITINLISNAIKFTEEGSVNVAVQRQSQGEWVIRVTDTGVGIPSHAQEFIFDRFRQMDGSSKRKHGGTGLGLAIVRDLTLMMGGNVRVKSEVGEGSTFTVLLPLVTELDDDIELLDLKAVGYTNVQN